MDSIIINSTNLRPNNMYNNVYEYTFPTNVNFKEGDTVSLSSLSLYNSFFNIKSSLGNNKYTYVWNASTITTHNITIPDGFYDVPTLNYFFQFQMVSNSHYMIDANGDNVYFFELMLDTTSYGTDLKFYPIPTSAEATTLGYTLPISATWVLPTTHKTPELILSQSFGELFGYETGTYPNDTSNFITVDSTLSGKIQQINSIIVTCNLVNSPYANPSHIVGSVNLTARYGSLLQYDAPYSIDQNIFPSNYKSIVITLYDQNMNNLPIKDVEGFLIRLVIKRIKR